MAPYKLSGNTILHKKGGKWSVKQKATSAKNAHIIMSNLQKLDKNPKAKVFGEGKRKKARKIRITK